MKKLTNTWKVAIGLTTFCACVVVSCLAGRMIGEATGDWIVNQLSKEG